MSSDVIHIVFDSLVGQTLDKEVTSWETVIDKVWFYTKSNSLNHVTYISCN